MFKVIYDEVGEHDLLFPCCRPEMYDFFYQNGRGHPNCYDNINHALSEQRPIIQPVNLFMFTKVDEDGKITILPPRSKAGNKVILQAIMDVRAGIAACSVAEGECNDRKCTPIKVIVEENFMKITEVKNRTPDLINRLLAVWESSVRATHLFLSDGEVQSIKEYVPQAKGFYEHMGFQVYKRTDLDEQGKPYPLLYMRLGKPAEERR